MMRPIARATVVKRGGFQGGCTPLGSPLPLTQDCEWRPWSQVLKQDAPRMVEILSDMIQNSTLDPKAVNNERGVILREMEEVRPPSSPTQTLRLVKRCKSTPPASVTDLPSANQLCDWSVWLLCQVVVARLHDFPGISHGWAFAHLCTDERLWKTC